MTDDRLPHTYPRRILLAVSGLSPQIVTETLYGLTVKQNPPFIPTEIWLITTLEGAHRARLSLLHPQEGYFHRFCRDYGYPAMTFTDQQIEVIRSAEGVELADIRSELHNEAAADTITRLVRQLTQDEACAIHASIAGGRKTMGYYLGYALSLFGRRQDRLSHVLVAEHYESHPDFYYPTRESRVIHTRDNRPLDTQQATVLLADIPFLRLREDIPDQLLTGASGFSETVNRAAALQQQIPHLTIHRDYTLRMGGEEVTLQPSLWAFYLWIVQGALLHETPYSKPHDADPDRHYSAAFLALYQQVRGEFSDTDRTDKVLAKEGMSGSYFGEKLSRVNKELEQQLGKRAAAPYQIVREGKRGASYYTVRLEREQIEGLEWLEA